MTPDEDVLARIMTRAIQKGGGTLLSAAECDAVERFAIDYAAGHGISIKPNPEPKPWSGAVGET